MAEYTKEEIFKKLREILASVFEIEEEKITMEANLFEDLEFDSIDAVDLAVKLQDFTQQKIPPENFKLIKTVDDVVEAVYELMKK